jgi:catechol 2,3-dioxygenase-like lactoylglutathione lyase family enzyme
MKLNSISGITYKVKDLETAARFYESLGFRMGKQDETHTTCYVNWFWVDLVADDAAGKDDAGTSLFIKVDSVDECYKDIVAQGYSPKSEPEKKASGNREFALSDPDGHQLVFFEKK